MGSYLWHPALHITERRVWGPCVFQQQMDHLALCKGSPLIAVVCVVQGDAAEKVRQRRISSANGVRRHIALSLTRIPSAPLPQALLIGLGLAEQRVWTVRSAAR